MSAPALLHAGLLLDVPKELFQIHSEIGRHLVRWGWAGVSPVEHSNYRADCRAKFCDCSERISLSVPNGSHTQGC